MTEIPKPGDPFPCPECGGRAWRGEYYTAVHQGVTLIVGEDGNPEPTDWLGDEADYDDLSEDEAYVCANPECGHRIDLGTFQLLSHPDLLLVSAAERVRVFVDRVTLALGQDGEPSRLRPSLGDIAHEARELLAEIAPEVTRTA